MPARSRAEPTTCADPGGVRSTTRLCRVRDLDDPVAEHPAEVVLGRALLLRAARGWRRRCSPPPARTLIAPSSSRSRDTVACVAITPSSASSSTSWPWLVTACCSSSRAIRCWRCFFASRGVPLVAAHGR